MAVEFIVIVDAVVSTVSVIDVPAIKVIMPLTPFTSNTLKGSCTLVSAISQPYMYIIHRSNGICGTVSRVKVPIRVINYRTQIHVHPIAAGVSLHPDPEFLQFHAQ